MSLNRSIITWIITGNVVALAVLVQRLHFLGYTMPLYDRFNSVGAALGMVNRQPPPCGHLTSTAFVITSSRIVFPDGVRPGAITVRAGRIQALSTKVPASSVLPLLDYGDAVISPGVVDVHAHLNEPGRTEWEGMDSGTAAMAAGGVTTAVDMPLNSDPVTTSAKLLAEKIALAQSKARVNLAFWGGLVPANARQAEVLTGLLDAGAVGVKCFMAPSGINDFPNVSESHLAAAVAVLAPRGAPLMAHAELVSEVEPPSESPDLRAHSTWEKSRPPHFEADAIAILAHVLKGMTAKPTPGFYVHVAHLGDAGSLPALQALKARLPLTVETCAHYLTFASEDIASGDTRFKCAPPLRGAANREALVAGVADRVIDLISSDHSPAPPSMKALDSGDFTKAWGGISGVQYLLPAAWTALKPSGVTFVRLSQLLSGNPATLVGLAGSRGAIKLGYAADLLVWDPDAPADTSALANQHRHKLTPYQDVTLVGRVLATFVNGNLVYTADKGVAPAACGGPLLRKWRPQGANDGQPK